MSIRPWGLVRFVVVAALFLCTGQMPARTAESRQAIGSGGALIVATKEAPPFAFKRSDGTWTGISIDLWKDIASDLGIRYELEETDLEGLIDGLRDGRFDVSVAALTVTADREAAVDFAQPYYVSGLGIATRLNDSAGWLAVLRQFLSPAFLKIVLTLAGVLFVVAMLVWFFERRANPDQFGGPLANGIGAGFWWSAVTMTTVGYGDKAPRTVGGRVVALIWMFAALIMISSFTAAVTASLTMGSLTGRIQGVDDLESVTVGTVAGSTSAAYLRDRQLPFRELSTPEEALEALEDSAVDAVVYDTALLRYLVRQRFGTTLVVLPESFARQYYGIAVPTGSVWRERINEALLKRTEAPEWQNLLARYFGPGR